jgi:hypothetical protein
MVHIYNLLKVFIILFLSLNLLNAQPIPSSPTAKYFYLDSQSSSFPTGVFVHVNDTINIIAEGTFYNGEGIVPSPDGFNGIPDSYPYGLPPLPSISSNALIGAIGDDSQNFKTLLNGGGTGIYGPGFVGSDFEGVATDSGQIYLGINDMPLNDNAGWLEVSIVINKLKIIKPKIDNTWIAGTKDTIKWENGVKNLFVKLSYSVDDGDNYELIDAGIESSDSIYIWDIPEDLLTTKAKIKIEKNNNSRKMAESDTYCIKPLIITKLDANGDYIPYDIDKDRWGFGNFPEKVWPPWYQIKFDYMGIDPITGYQYDLLECGGVFYLADPADFPDWISFVNAFSVDACYIRTTPPVAYSLAALERWSAKKGIWGGSCFGIAASNALAFNRRQDYRSNFPAVSYFVNPITLTQPDSGDITAITTLFTHQYGNPTIANDNISYNIKTPNQTLSEIIEMLKEDEVKIKTLSIYNNHGSGGHTILAYKVEEDDVEPQYFYVWVYDNSYPNVNNGIITIDTSANSGKGVWNVAYGWDNWGGTKNIYLEIPDSNYLHSATLNKMAHFQSPFILKQNEVEIENTSGAEIVIKDNNNNITGFQNNQLLCNIPGSRPLIIKNGSGGPPYGYSLSNENYEIELSNFSSTEPSFYLFTDNKSFSVKRNDAVQTQIDKIKYWSEQRLEISNSDNELKSYQLTEIINDSDMEKMFIIRNVDMNQNDILDLTNIDSDKLKITNTGSQKNYEIELESTSDNGFLRFLNHNIILPISSNHTLVPDWTNIQTQELLILEDLDNNGTIDDTLHLENQLTGVNEQQGSLIPTEYKLEQNYPNPFNSTTVIKYSIPKEGLVTLKIYNIIGQEVASLVNETKQAGNYEVTFNSDQLTSGVYLYKLTSEGFTETKKMMLLK